MHNGKNSSNEKAKDFNLAIKRLVNSLRDYKILIIISLLFAAISSILSLVSPNRLSDLTDEIAKGLVINTENMSKLQNDLNTYINEENIGSTISDILKLNIDNNTIYKVQSSNISNEDKVLFMNTLSNINNDRENIFKYIGSLPDSVLNIILEDTIYNDINISVNDKIDLIKLFANIKEKDYSNIVNMPDSIKKALFPDGEIDGVLITTSDKIEFISVMSKIDKGASTNEMYKLVGKLPDNIQKIINPSMNMVEVKRITLLLVILYVLSAIFNYIESFTMVKVSNSYSKKLRTRISKKINKLPLKFFDNNLSGDVLSRVTNDVDTIAQALNTSLSTLVAAGTLFIGSIIMMFVTNYIMAFTAIIASIFGFVFMFLILGKSQKYFTKRQEELGKLNGYIEEVYSGINVVKTCNAKEEVNDKFYELNNNLYEYNRKSQFLSGLMHPIMSFVGNLGYVAVCVVGALLVSKDMITFGVIVAFITYVRLFTSPLSQIAQSMTSMQQVAAASERVFNFLDEEEMVSEKDITNKLDVSSVKGNIEFKNVKFGYDDNKIIINDFTAKVKPGQKIAIVGPTGAGKTTMVNLLMKFYDIKSGDILIDGISIKELSRNNIHSLFTMVLQDTWLFNGTIKENIIYNRKNISDKKVKDVCKIVGVDHFINTLPDGYDSVLSDSDSVSAGQRQLITIARGMIEDSPFLILDEATSNVDTRTEELVQKAMDKLMKDKTSFIIAHRLSTIKNADLILVMNEGNIVEQGSHRELMKLNGFYANLYNSQFEKVE